MICASLCLACHYFEQSELDNIETLNCSTSSKDTINTLKIYFDCELTKNMKLHSMGGEFFSNLPSKYYEINSLDPQSDIFNQFILTEDTTKIVEFSLLFLTDTVGVINSLINYNRSKKNFYSNYYYYQDTNFVDKSKKNINELMYIRKIGNKFRLFMKKSVVYEEYLLASVIQDQFFEIDTALAKIKSYNNYLNTLVRK